MLTNNYICALDIGSSKIAAVAAKIRKGQISELFFSEEPVKGMHQGSIVDSIQLINSLTRSLKNLKAKSGLNIRSVFTNICGEDITTRHSRAIIPLAVRGNKVITVSDCEKVNEQARVLGSSLEEEIIHEIPFSYNIDSKNNIFNPLGLYSHRLEVDLYLVYAKLSSLQTLTRAINQAGYELKDLFLSGIATSSAIASSELRAGINVFCDIGSDITEILVFKEGSLRQIEILEMGGESLTLGLTENLKIPRDLAEEVKRSLSVGDFERTSENKEILVKKDNLYKPIKQKLASQIISKEAELICEKIKSVVEKSVSVNELNNFYCVGRTVFLAGVIETLEAKLGIPVKLGRISNSQLAPLLLKYDALSDQRYLTYITALGIICQAMQEDPAHFVSLAKTARRPVSKMVDRIREVYQEYF